MKQKTKQTGGLLNSSLFTAQFATLIVHLKVTGIPACVCVKYIRYIVWMPVRGQKCLPCGGCTSALEHE